MHKGTQDFRKTKFINSKYDLVQRKILYIKKRVTKLLASKEPNKLTDFFSLKHCSSLDMWIFCFLFFNMTDLIKLNC